MSLNTIPIVDLAPVIAGAEDAQERAAAELKAACNSVGFFFVKNHGVPKDMLEGIIEESARFHAQPMEEKWKVKVDTDLLGYLPPGGQTQATSIYNKNTRRETSASFYCRRQLPDDHPDQVAGEIWTHNNRWPENLPGFRENVQAYFEALGGLLQHLLPLFSITLGLAPDYLSKHEAFSPPNPNLRLLEYIPQKPDQDNLYGIGPHSDYSCITILNQGPSKGLDILLSDGEWVSAPMLPGHLLINTGAFLARWCNDRIPATPHRVINETGELRHSVAFLVATRPDVVCECLPNCHGPDNPPKYAPTNYADYIAAIRKVNYHLNDKDAAE